MAFLDVSSGQGRGLADRSLWWRSMIHERAAYSRECSIYLKSGVCFSLGTALSCLIQFTVSPHFPIVVAIILFISTRYSPMFF